MSITKNHLHYDIKTLEISRNRFLGGIILALIYSFIIYSLFYLTRESFRILSVNDNYDLWILSDTEVNFYNLFYAFLAVIFAQSICFSFWFSKHKRMFGSYSHRRISIINDQSVLNWYFILWFAKMSVFYCTFFGFMGGFYVFSLYADYDYLFILLVIVLYLHSWNTIRLIFKNKALKWMLVSIVIVSGLSIGISRINLIDYNAINETVLEMNNYYKYNIEIPESNVYTRLENLSLIENIYVAMSNKSNNTPILIIDNREIELKDLSQIIDNWRAYYDDTDIPRMKYQLHIDSKVPMSFVNNLKKELSNNYVSKITYAVLPEIQEYNKRYYRNYVLMHYIGCYRTNDFIPPPHESYFDLKKYENIIEIKTGGKDYCYFNSNMIKTDSLKEHIKWQFMKNEDYIIKYNISNSDTFSSYIKLLIIANEAINEMRNDYAELHYMQEFEDLDMDRKINIENKIPLRIYEGVE